MIELYHVYDYYGAYVDFYHDYETALSMANCCGGYVVSSFETDYDDPDDDDWEDDLKGKHARKKSTIKKKNGKFGYIV